MTASFQLLAAHSVLDFVNTFNRFGDTGSTELMTTYGDLLAFLGQAQVLDARQICGLCGKAGSSAAPGVLHRALELREVLASVFHAIAEQGKPPQQALKRLEHYIVDAQSHRELGWTDENLGSAHALRAQWAWGRFETHLDLAVWVIAHSAAELLVSSAITHVHACASQTCRWLFLDTSKNHSRRWCDMAICGNRMKARRFQRRR